MHSCGSWTIKKAEHWRVDAFKLVLEKTLESPLDCKEIKSINPKNQPWIFIGRTDAEAEAPVLWSLDVKSQLIGKDPDAGSDWRQKEKGATKDELAGWLHQLNGREFEQTLGDGEGQGSLAWCSPWGRKESDMTERLKWTELDQNPPSSSVHETLQARMLKWVAIFLLQGIFTNQGSIWCLSLLLWEVICLFVCFCLILAPSGKSS